MYLERCFRVTLVEKHNTSNTVTECTCSRNIEIIDVTTG